LAEQEQIQTLTWREIQDQWDKGVLADGDAHDYLGDLLSLIAVQAPQLLDETTQAYGPVTTESGLPATETADLK
jgi:hypothetical protein